MRRIVLGFLLLAFATLPAAGQQETRVALVITNAIYHSQAALKNPHNDGDDITAALTRAGFVVTQKKDLTWLQMDTAIRDFRRAAQAADVALIYYGGHGVEIGQNYLLPVDARLEKADDIEAEGIRLDGLREAVALARRRVGIVIIDACRDNPFLASLAARPGQPLLPKAIGPVDHVLGTVTGFAAESGAVARDDGRDRRNSPYTAGLLKHIDEPGLELNLFFTKVSNTVLADTAGRQHPYHVATGLGSEFHFKPRTEVAALPDFDQRIEDAYWDSIKNSTRREDYQGYLRAYPRGRYGLLAQQALARIPEPGLLPPEPPAAPAPPANTAELEERALRLSDADRAQAQGGLNVLGYPVGAPDGRFGPRTRSAIATWQKETGAEQTGYLNRKQVDTLISRAPNIANKPVAVDLPPLPPLYVPPAPPVVEAKVYAPLPALPAPSLGRRNGQGDPITIAETKIKLAERIRGQWCAKDGAETLAITPEAAPEIRLGATGANAPDGAGDYRISGFAIYPEHVTVSVLGAGGKADEWVFYAAETRGRRIVLMRATLVAGLLWRDYGRPFDRCG